MRRGKRKADAKLILDALNAYRSRKPRTRMTDYDRALAKAKTHMNANLRKPMPKATAYK